MTRERVKEQMILMGRVRSMLAQRPGLGSLTATSISDEVSISMLEAYPCSSLKMGGKMWTQACERMEHWAKWTLIPRNTPWPYHLPCNPLHPAHHLIGRCASPPASTLPPAAQGNCQSEEKCFSNGQWVLRYFFWIIFSYFYLVLIIETTQFVSGNPVSRSPRGTNKNKEVLF